MDLDRALRKAAYDITTKWGLPPTIADLSAMCAASEPDVRAGLTRLAAARMVVLQPSGELLMVPPFSAVPTPFVVRTRRHTSYANCIWDALGVAVMLRESADVTTACGCCGDAMTLHAHHDEPPGGSGVIHFAIPARRWWEDVVFT